MRELAAEKALAESLRREIMQLEQKGTGMALRLVEQENIIASLRCGSPKRARGVKGSGFPANVPETGTSNGCDLLRV